MIEAKKLAYADLLPVCRRSPVHSCTGEQLLSKQLAKKRADYIDPAHAHCSVSPSDVGEKLNAAGRDTTYLTTIDQDGNIVSLIQSNFARSVPALSRPEPGSHCKTVASYLHWIPISQIHLRLTSVRCTPSFRDSCRRAMR